MIKKVSVWIILIFIIMVIPYENVYAKKSKKANAQSRNAIYVDNTELYMKFRYQQGYVDKLENMWLTLSVVPKVVDINRNNAAMIMFWEDIKDVDGYYVYKRTEEGIWYEVSHVFAKDKCCYIDKSYFKNNQYKNISYTVVAYKNINNKQIYSNYDKVGACVIETPIIKKLTKNNLIWHKVSNADGYEICYRDVNTTKWKKIATVNDRENEYNISKFYKDKRYYTVKAYKILDSGKIYSGFEEKITLRHRLYSDKNMLFEGDGIMKGLLSRDSVDISYPKRIEQLLSSEIIVNANKGDKAIDIVKRIRKRDKYFKKYDVIFIAIGSNDYEESTEIGTIVDDDTDTFYGALNYIAKKINKQNPTGKVVFCTPFYKGKYKKKKNINCNYKKNKEDNTLEDYSDAIKSVAQINDYYIYDANMKGSITPNNYLYATENGIYPTQEYHSKIGSDIVDYLIENSILNTKK